MKEGHKAEVLDLINENVKCDTYGNDTMTTTGTSGGKLNDEFVLCGGDSDKCFVLGENNPIENVTLSNVRRNFNGAVILPNNTLFIIGTN